MTPELSQVLAGMKDRGDHKLVDGAVLRIFKAYAVAMPEIIDEALIIGIRQGLRAPLTDDERTAKARDTAEKRTRRKAWEKSQEDYARDHGIAREAVSHHRVQQVFAPFVELAEKASRLDRIVELLDLWTVGEKLLGDCSRSDLLTAAKYDRERGFGLIRNADAYQHLAELLAGDETLRESNKRREIIEVLRSLVDGHDVRLNATGDDAGRPDRSDGREPGGEGNLEGAGKRPRPAGAGKIQRANKGGADARTP